MLTSIYKICFTLPVKYRFCSKQTNAGLLHAQKHERHPSPWLRRPRVGRGPCVKCQAALWGSAGLVSKVGAGWAAEPGSLGPFTFVPPPPHPLRSLRPPFLKLGCAQQQWGCWQQLQAAQLHTSLFELPSSRP